MRATGASVALLLGLALVVSGCAGPATGPPEIVVDRTACDHCGMLVSDPRFAGALRPAGGTAAVFDDLGCLRAAISDVEAGGGDVDALAIWVRDSRGGGWLDARTAWYVESRALATPMGSGVEAFATEQAARQLLSRLSAGTALDFALYVGGETSGVQTLGATR